MARTHGALRGLHRFEGFTDAVFAIALTLLIVEIKPPGTPEGPPTGASLLHAMAAQWRDHLALLLSYAFIGIYWLQHHYSGRIYAKSDHVFSVINLLFLLAIVWIPYPIRVWCFHVGTPHERTAAITLTAAAAAAVLAWMGKWLYALPGRRIIDERLSDDFLRQMTRRFGIAALLQVAAVPLAIVAPRPGVVLSLATNFFFVLPQPKPRYRPGEEPEQEEVKNE
jgi:uncharacterized membrane protein